MAPSSNGYTLQIRISQGLDHSWKDYPTHALRILLLEEVHLSYSHIGAPKMAKLVGDRYYWPALNEDCVAFVKACFSCQLCDQSVTAPKWSSMVPLPPGPRHTYAMDLLVDLPQT